MALLFGDGLMMISGDGLMMSKKLVRLLAGSGLLGLYLGIVSIVDSTEIQSESISSVVDAKKSAVTDSTVTELPADALEDLDAEDFNAINKEIRRPNLLKNPLNLRTLLKTPKPVRDQLNLFPKILSISKTAQRNLKLNLKNRLGLEKIADGTTQREGFEHSKSSPRGLESRDHQSSRDYLEPRDLQIDTSTIGFCTHQGPYKRNEQGICEKCLDTSFCAGSMICDPFHRLCYNPGINNTQKIENQCEDVKKDLAGISFSAGCQFACNFVDQGCNCANEDFSCNWVPGCYLDPMKAGCLKSCQNHDAYIPSDFGCPKNCFQCRTQYGCGTDEKGKRVRLLCPLICGTDECKSRCSIKEEKGRRHYTPVTKKEMDQSIAIMNAQSITTTTTTQSPTTTSLGPTTVAPSGGGNGTTNNSTSRILLDEGYYGNSDSRHIDPKFYRYLDQSTDEYWNTVPYALYVNPNANPTERVRSSMNNNRDEGVSNNMTRSERYLTQILGLSSSSSSASSSGTTGLVDNNAGTQCWDAFINHGEECITMIKQGFDCSCACGRMYTNLVTSTTKTNKKLRRYVFNKKSSTSANFELDIIVRAGVMFRLQMTGLKLNTERVREAYRSKVKIVADPGDPNRNADCSFPIHKDVIGLHVDASAPKVATQFYLAYDGITISSCGKFRVCHCRGSDQDPNLCEDSGYWYEVGKIQSVPPPALDLPAGGFSKPVPGCPSPVDQLPLELNNLRGKISTSEMEMDVSTDSIIDGMLKMELSMRNFKISDFNIQWEQGLKNMCFYSFRSYNKLMNADPKIKNGWFPTMDMLHVSINDKDKPFNFRRMEGKNANGKNTGIYEERLDAYEKKLSDNINENDGEHDGTLKITGVSFHSSEESSQQEERKKQKNDPEEIWQARLKSGYYTHRILYSKADEEMKREKEITTGIREKEITTGILESLSDDKERDVTDVNLNEVSLIDPILSDSSSDIYRKARRRMAMEWAVRKLIKREKKIRDQQNREKKIENNQRNENNEQKEELHGDDEKYDEYDWTRLLTSTQLGKIKVDILNYGNLMRNEEVLFNEMLESDKKDAYREYKKTKLMRENQLFVLKEEIEDKKRKLIEETRIEHANEHEFFIREHEKKIKTYEKEIVEINALIIQTEKEEAYKDQLRKEGAERERKLEGEKKENSLVENSMENYGNLRGFVEKLDTQISWTRSNLYNHDSKNFGNYHGNELAMHKLELQMEAEETKKRKLAGNECTDNDTAWKAAIGSELSYPTCAEAAANLSVEGVCTWKSENLPSARAVGCKGTCAKYICGPDSLAFQQSEATTTVNPLIDVPAAQSVYIYIHYKCQTCKQQLLDKITPLQKDPTTLQLMIYKFVVADSANPVNFPNTFWANIAQIEDSMASPPAEGSADGSGNAVLIIIFVLIFMIGIAVVMYIIIQKRRDYYQEIGEEDPLIPIFMKASVILILPIVILGFIAYKCHEYYEKRKADQESDDGMDQPPPPEGYPPYVGAECILKNLTKVEFNGLKGRLIRYQEEKDRWLVDVTIYTNTSEEEHKELSLKNENVKVLKPQVATRRTGGGPRAKAKPKYTNKTDVEMFAAMEDSGGGHDEKEYTAEEWAEWERQQQVIQQQVVKQPKQQPKKFQASAQSKAKPKAIGNAPGGGKSYRKK